MFVVYLLERQFLFFRRRVSAHASSSSTSDSSSDSEGIGPLTNGDLDSRPERTARLAKSTALKRMRCLPTNLDILGVYTNSKKPSTRTSNGGAGSGIGALNIDLNSKGRRTNNNAVSLADAESIEIDRTITFDDIGGLDSIICSLKEMIVLPLVYPEVFQHYKIKPPRGVLFYGPPGTGKTLVARALVNECSSPDRRISFFMRKGADCLCKYVGESERQLRVLFEQAYQQRPSIIFFDEIDGLAPVRSARQDQIHASIVSTLLALMDGLDNRGEVVVIGATNRLDAIDPALRRPGRFDREFRFSLPTLDARKQILKIHMKEWESKPHEGFIDELAIRTASFCGADLKSLCQEAFLSALRRRFPQIYNSRQKYKIDPRSLHLSRGDFYSALHRIVPASHRGCQHPVGRPLDIHLMPLLSEQLDKCLNQLNELFFKRTILSKNSNSMPFQSISDDLTSTSALLKKASSLGLTTSFASSSHRSATFTMKSTSDNGLCRFFAPAVVQQLDCAFFIFELGYLHAQTSRTPEEACAQLFTEARRSAPAIIYVPDIDNLWPKLSESVQYMFVSNVRTLPPNLPILILIALETDSFDDIHPDISQIISPKSTFTLSVPNSQDRYAFFAPLFHEEMFSSLTTTETAKEPIQEVLELAEPAPVSLARTQQELERLQLREEATMTELRVFLRDMLKVLLRDKRFTYFSRPIDVEDVPDYYDVIESPMTFSMMLEKVDKHGYSSVKQFTQDIDLIVSNALLYNPDHTTQGRLIRHRACELRDVCQFHINAELDMDFELLCQQVTEARKQRGDDPRASLPDYVFTDQAVSAAAAASDINNQDNENASQNDTENQLDLTNKTLNNTTDQSDAPLDTSTISTRNSSRRSKSNVSQRSTLTRKQAKEKELVNGHNEETVLSAEDAGSAPATTEASTKPPTPTHNTTESIATATNQSSSSSSPSLEHSNKKRVKRTVSSTSLSPSKLTSVDDTSTDTKAKRQRTEEPSVKTIESAPVNIEQNEISRKQVDIERLESNLNYLVEHTNNYAVEKLSQVWFELFDIIESCRSLPSDELIFEENDVYMCDMAFLENQSDTLTASINGKVGYIKFDHLDSVHGALNMTNIIFIDKPLIVTQVFINEIPHETDAMIYCAPLDPNIRLLSGGPTWPSTVINRLVGQPPNAIIETIDPELSDRYLPPYPPLQGILDISKVEEIRRTVYLSNLDKDISLEVLHEFISQIGEIRYIRAAYTDENAETRSAYVEFSEQPSIPKVLSINGFQFFNRPLFVNHTSTHIIKPAIVRDVRSDDEETKLNQSHSRSTSRRQDNGTQDESDDGHHSSSKSKSRKKSSKAKHSSNSRSKSRKHSRSRDRKNRSRSNDHYRRNKH
ncbi:unnamed protein product [Rotaria socialis]|uniref:Bromo domain-containing protein n=1 Tax=Rotaria socialis TaxID=392032 RepID=A0A820SHE0_9BILA|nr:unnamed protein product [Rotaria socialis]